MCCIILMWHTKSSTRTAPAFHATPGSAWWNIKLDGAAGELLVAADGATVVSRQNLPLSILAPLDTFVIGIIYSEDPVTIWLDDVFIGLRRPGCD